MLRYDWLRALLYLTRESDFSQTSGFNTIIKVIMAHDLKAKNVHMKELFLCKI